MLQSVFNKTNWLRLSLFTSAGILFTACSSLGQQPYDVDGIYNNSKIAVKETHNNTKYYTEYFKEKNEEVNEYFTDIDNYSSYEQGNAAWGDTTSETQIVYNYNGFGWGYPYNSWYDWGWSFGWNYGWGGYWGYPYYGWGYPYYGYGWNYPYYSHHYRNVSRNYSNRALTNRQLISNNSGRMGNRSPNTRMLRTHSTDTGRSMMRTDKTFSRVNSTLNRMDVETRINRSNTTRDTRNDFNTNTRTRTNNTTRFENNRSTNTRVERPVSRPTYTPSSSSRMNSGSMGRSSSSGSMRSGGGRR